MGDVTEAAGAVGRARRRRGRDAAARGLGGLLRGRAGQPPRRRGARGDGRAGRGGRGRASPSSGDARRRGEGARRAGRLAGPARTDRRVRGGPRPGPRRGPARRRPAAGHRHPRRAPPLPRCGARTPSPGPAGGASTSCGCCASRAGRRRSRRRRCAARRCSRRCAGRDDAARRMLASARRSLEELGHEHGLLEVDLAAGMVETAGRRARRRRAASCERAHEGFHELGIDVDAGLAAALLARVRLAPATPTRRSSSPARARSSAATTSRPPSPGAPCGPRRWPTRRARRGPPPRRGGGGAGRAHRRARSTTPTRSWRWPRCCRTPATRRRRPAAPAQALELYERKEASVPAARAADAARDRVPRPPSAELAGGRGLERGEPADLHVAVAELDVGQGAAALENAATRFCARWVPRLLAHDWVAVREMFAEDVVGGDRRPLLGGHGGISSVCDVVIEGNKACWRWGSPPSSSTPARHRRGPRRADARGVRRRGGVEHVLQVMAGDRGRSPLAQRDLRPRPARRGRGPPAASWRRRDPRPREPRARGSRRCRGARRRAGRRQTTSTTRPSVLAVASTIWRWPATGTRVAGTSIRSVTLRRPASLGGRHRDALTGVLEATDFLRAAFASGIERVDISVIAVAASRLAVCRALNIGTRGEVDTLSFVELDEAGVTVQLGVYEPSQLVEALQHLDDTYRDHLAVEENPGEADLAGVPGCGARR